MAWTLAVITSVERLWPHDDLAGGTFVFGLNLHTAMVGTASLSDADFTRLEPWQWSSLDGVDFWAIPTGPGAGQPFLKTGQSGTILQWPSSAPPVDSTDAANAIMARRGAMKTLNGPVPFVWTPGETQSPTPPPLGFYHHLMGSISLLGGALGQALKLTAIVQVQASQIDTTTFPLGTGGSFPTNLQLFAAPRFTASGGATHYKPSPSGPTQVQSAQYFEWPYLDPTSSNPASAYTIAIALDPGPPDPTSAAAPLPTEFFNLNTYWVRKQIPSGFDRTAQQPTYNAAIDPGKNDWHLRLADGIADAWNLPRHLLDAAKAWAALPAQDFNVLWPAILASLRDRAGIGLLPAPDGHSLVSLALDRSQLPADIVALNWIERLRLQDRMTSLRSWQQQLTTSLEISPANLPAAPPPQTAQVEVTWMTPFPAIVSSPATIKASLQRADTPDTSNWSDVPGLVDQQLQMVRVGAGQTTAFKLSLVSQAVTPGWYRGRSTDGLGNPIFTSPVNVAIPLSDALAPLASASASLQQDDALSALVASLWQQASTSPLTLPVGVRSARSFTAVQSPTVPDQLATWAEQGALALDNGSGWAVTLANLALALPHDPKLSIQTWLPQVINVWLPQVVKVVTGSATPIVQQTHGSYTLTYGGTSITVDATDPNPAQTIQGNLEPLVGGKGMVTVGSYSPNPATLYLSFQFAALDAKQISAAGTGGLTATVFNLATLLGTGRTFTLKVGTQQTAPLPFNTPAAEVQSALESLTKVRAGNVAVAMSTDQNGTITTYTIAFADQSQPQIVTSVQMDIHQPDFGIAAAVSTLVAVSANPGTFTLQIGSQTTAALSADTTKTTAAMVQDAVQNLPGVGNASVVATIDVNGNPAFSITFTTPGLPQIGTGQAGGVTASALMLLTVSGTAGTFTLKVGPQTTQTPLKFNASASDIQTALEALSNVGAGKVHVNTYAIGPAVFSIVFDDETLPQVVAVGTGGTTATVSTLVTVIPSTGQFTLTLSAQDATGPQTAGPLSAGISSDNLRTALANTLANLAVQPKKLPIGTGVTVASTTDPSGTTVYTITFLDPRVTLTAAGSGNVTATVATFWGNYEIVAESVPPGKKAAPFLRVGASLQGNAGQATNNQLTVTVFNPTLTGTGPLTKSITVASAGNSSHSLRLIFWPANALMVHVGGAGGQFTLASGTQSSTLNVGALAPAVQSTVANVTGLASWQLTVTANTQTDGSVVYTIVSTVALPAITGLAQGGATINVSTLLAVQVWLNLVTPIAAPTDWTSVFGNQLILVPVDQVPQSAIGVRHGLKTTANPLPGAELLQLVSPAYFTSTATTLAAFLAALGNHWDSVNGAPAPLDRTGAFWQTNATVLKAAISYASPRRRLALGQTGRLWPVWNYNDPTVVKLREHIETQFSTYLTKLADQRFGWPNQDALHSGPYLDFTQDFPNPLPTASSALQTAIETFLNRFATHIITLKQLIPPNADNPPKTGIIPQEQNADLVPATKPHALTLQVDRFDAETSTPAIGTDQDAMTHLAGVGVLLRQAAANPATPANPFAGQPWRMLNLADLSAPKSTTPGLIDSDATPITCGIVGPARLHHRNGARHNVITYDNQYLLAQSPLAGVAVAKGFQDQLAFMLAVGGTNGSFVLNLMPTVPGTTPPPPFKQPVTLDASGLPTPTIPVAVKNLLNAAGITTDPLITPTTGANGSTVYTIYFPFDKPVPVLSVDPASVTGQATAALVGSPDEDVNASVFRSDPPSLIPTSLDPNPLGVSWGKVPSLKFGQMVEGQVFLIGNCGAMPKELAPTHPLVLQPGPVTMPPDENVVHRLRYLRRVGMGTPRLVPGTNLAVLGEAPAGATPAASGLPSLPPGLLPLAKELGLHALSANLPIERFFFDTSGRVGQLNPGTVWSLTLPHVAATGSAPQVDTDPGSAVSWQIRFGLQATDPYGNIIGQFSMLVVRAGPALTLTLDNVIATESPAAGISTPLTTRVQIVAVQGVAGKYALTYSGASGTNSTGLLPFQPPAEDAWEPADLNNEINPLQNALCGAAQLGTGNVKVDGFHSSGACLFTITPAGKLAQQTLPPLSGTNISGTTATVFPNMLFSGPIDLQLRRNSGQLSFCWRRSDRDEPWICPPTLVWNLTAADLLVDTSRCFIQVAIGDPSAVAPTFGIPTVTTASSAPGSGDLTPPPENEPVTVLMPPYVNGDPAPEGGSMTFAIRPPGVDLQTWTRWYDMDLFLGANGASSDVRTKVWIAYQSLLPVTDPDQHNQGLDLSFDDPAVSGLLFELVPLLVEPTSQYLQITGTAGSFTLSCAGSSTNPLQVSDQLLADIQRELQALPTIGTNSVVVTLLAQTGSTLYAITPSGALAGESLPPIQVSAVSGLTVTVLPAQNLQPIQRYCDVVKAQLVTVSQTTSGSNNTFSLTLNGQTTSAMPFDASSQLVQNALGNLAGIGVANVNVTSWQPGPNTTNYSITGKGPFAIPGLPPVFAGQTTGNVSVHVPSDRKGLPYYVQTAPFIVNVISTTHLPRLDWDGDRIVTIRVSEQEIWELRVYPAISKSFFTASDVPGSQRFHTAFGACATPNSGLVTNSLGTPGDRVDPGASTPYYLFTPWRLTIEVATEQVMLLGPLVTPTTPPPSVRLKLAQALAWQAVQPSFDGRSVSVTFDKTSPALISNPQRDASGNTASPTLAANSIPGDPRRYRYATTIQLLRQVWRWEGRPIPELPFEAAAFIQPPAGLAMDPSQGPDQLPIDAVPSGCAISTGVDLNSSVQNLQLWDATGFGDRTGVDVLGQTTNVGYGTASSTLFVEDLTGDPRALYYRFNPVLFSRYASLFSTAPPFLTAAGYDPFAQSSTDLALGSVTPWRRLIVPCRWSGEVPRPVVRFIVPLTQPDDTSDADPVQETGITTSGSNAITGLSSTAVLTIGMAVTASSFPSETTIQSIDSATQVTASQPASTSDANALLTFSANNAAKTPGLLVVLDETVLTTGGLAETIEADVVRVDDAYNGLPTQSRPEFGPDPTLRARGWTQKPITVPNDPAPPPAQAIAMNVVGPLGHTFDTADAPLFVTSSYFVHPPQMDSNPIGDPSLAWYFIKTRFRRLLVPEGQLGYLPLSKWVPIPYTPSQPFTPPLATNQDWIISITGITVPAATASQLVLQLMLGTNPACTLTIKATPPTSASLTGNISLAIDSPPATAMFKWFSPATTEAITLLDLRFVLQQDQSTLPEGPIVVKVQGAGQFTITYSGHSATFNAGDSATVVQTGLHNPPISANVSVSLQTDQGPPVVNTYTIDVEDNSNPQVSVVGTGGATATITSAPLPVQLHFTVSYRLRTPTDSMINAWQSLQSTAWQGQVNGTPAWPTSVVATGTATKMREPRALAALVSPFTSPYWVQFLANTQRLVPSDASTYELQWIPPSSPTPSPGQPQFKLIDAMGNAGTWNLGPTAVQPAEAGSDVGFARILLLTEVVRDVTGVLGPERYLGLYYLDSPATFSCQHRSPALSPDVYEELTISQVSARVVEVQARVTPIDPITQKSAYQFPRPDFWADIFGDPRNVDTQSAPDAVSRIVGVSAPVPLKVLNAQSNFTYLISSRQNQADLASRPGRHSPWRPALTTDARF